MTQLERVQAQADEPDKIASLITLIRNDLGFRLHRAVQAVKYELSSQASSRFTFRDGGLDLDVAVTRDEFEGWIAPELAAIRSCVDTLLADAGVGAAQVDQVFLTGGTSQVPAVRHIFESRFGPARVRSGHEFTSVVRGLSLAATLDVPQEIHERR